MKRIIYIVSFILFALFFLIITIRQHKIYSQGDLVSPLSKNTPSITEIKKDIGILEEISFSQFKDGKKVWNLHAKSMQNEGDTVILMSVYGNGITSENKKFYFYAKDVWLNKRDYSFTAEKNVKFVFGNKKILSDKLIYDSKRNIYIIFHGIIYINNKISFSGKKIVFDPSSSKLIIGGEND